METAVWIIAIFIAARVLASAIGAGFDLYLMRTKYNDRSRIKKSLNWLLNGSYE